MGRVAWLVILTVLSLLITAAVFIVNILPDARKSLNVGASEIGLGIGFLAFLILDFLVCTFILGRLF